MPGRETSAERMMIMIMTMKVTVMVIAMTVMEMMITIMIKVSTRISPILPGEYGGWMEALNHGDLQSMFVLAEPAKIPLHNFYEFIWFLRTGGPRLVRFHWDCLCFFFSVISNCVHWLVS